MEVWLTLATQPLVFFAGIWPEVFFFVSMAKEKYGPGLQIKGTRTNLPVVLSLPRLCALREDAGARHSSDHL